MQQTAGEGWGDAEICRFLLGTNAAQLHGTYLPMWFMQRNHANKYKAALAVENERNLPDGRKNIPFQPPGSRAPPPGTAASPSSESRSSKSTLRSFLDESRGQLEPEGNGCSQTEAELLLEVIAGTQHVGAAGTDAGWE